MRLPSLTKRYCLGLLLIILAAGVGGIALWHSGKKDGSANSTRAGGITKHPRNIQETAEIAPEEVLKLAQSEVDLPFLGKIKTRKMVRPFKFRKKDGSTIDLPLSIHYSETGNFVRAEYQSSVTTHPIFGKEGIESGLRSCGEKIVGLPSAPMKIGLEELFKRTASSKELGDAERIDVTYELLDTPNFQGRPVITVRLVGVEMPISTGHVGVIMRVRYVFDEKGDLIFLDNGA